MACIVYQTDKRTGIKYAYSSESYWDKDKKQPRSKRTFLGKVDPVTGKIIPKKSKSEPETLPEKNLSDQSHIIESLQNKSDEKDALITQLRRELKELTARYNSIIKAVKKINDIASSFSEE